MLQKDQAARGLARLGRQLADQWPRLVRLAAAVAVVQAVYWLIITPFVFERPGLPPNFPLSPSVAAARLDAPTREAFDRAQFKPAELPWTDCCDRGYRALKFTFDLPRVPPSGLGLIPSIDADNMMVFVNGRLVLADGRMALPRPSYEGNKRVVRFISPDLVQPGVNRLDYIMTRSSMPYFDVGRPTLVDYGAVQKAFAHRTFILNDFELMTFGLGAVIAVIAFALLLRADEKALPFWVLVLTLSGALNSQFFHWDDPPFSAQGRMIYYFLVTNGVALAWPNVIDSWSGRPRRWMWITTSAAFAAIMVVCIWGMAHATEGGFDLASDTTNYFGLAMAGIAIIRFASRLPRIPEDRLWESAIFALCITLMAGDLVSELFLHKTQGMLIQSLPLVLLGFTVAFLARNIRLFQSRGALTALLSEQLAEREAQIAESYARERDLVRRQAFQDERQRIMRDMHDGVGSQLMAMLLASRRGKLTPEKVSESVQSVIDEMRLMIDSMDSVGESLSTALTTFRERVQGRVQGAGLTLVWTDDYGEALPDYDPRQALQVFRILQEAVNNAVKHSGGSRVLLTIARQDDPAFPVRITVADDGKTQGAGKGRGLDNMRARAEGVGARLSITAEPGVIVRLDLPKTAA